MIIGQANLKGKWGQTPAWYFVCAFYFLGSHPIKGTDRDSMIAKMHSCERSDQIAKLSRDVESLGHHGTKTSVQIRC